MEQTEAATRPRFRLEALGDDPDSWNLGEGSMTPGDGSGNPGCAVIASAVSTWAALQHGDVTVAKAAEVFNATPSVIVEAIERYDHWYVFVSKRGPTPDRWFIEHDGE